MTLIVADASPIRYLVAIDAIEVLPHLFDRIVVPSLVIEKELQAPNSPPVKRWAMTLPNWLQIASPAKRENLRLHAGETDAILLAAELNATAVLLDDL